MEYLTVSEVASRLGLPERAIYRPIDEGKLGALRWPVRIPLDEVEAVLERCRIKPGELGASLNQYRATTMARYYSRRG